MKKHISLLIIGLLMSTFMWAVSTTGSAALKQMNPYTFNMQRVLSGENIVFRYSLNATATSIDILVDVNEDGKFDEVAYTIKDANKLTRSSVDGNNIQYEVSIPLTEFKQKLTQNAGDFEAGDYNWAMRANRAAYSAPTHAYPTDWGRLVYNMPKGLAIDNNPESNYFGNIYTTESKQCTSADKVGNTLAGGTKTNYAKGEGVYAYYPTFDQYMYPTDHTCYKGGVDWKGSSTTSDEYAPFRLAVAPDGMVFVNDNRKKDDGVTAALYRIQPSKLNTNLNFGKILYPGGLSKCSVDGHPRAMSMAIMNVGGVQKLYVLNAYRRSSTDGSYSYHPHLHRWTLDGTNIGTQEKEWVVCKNTKDNVESVLTYGGKNYEIVNQTTTMVPGIHNDLWIAQRRIQQDANACLLHVKINGDNLVLDYVIVKNTTGATSINAHLLQMHDNQACPKGAMALSADGSMLALASSGWVNVMNVTYDANGTPTLTRDDSKSFELLTTQGAPVIINALAFDRANNLYAMSETTHQLYIYALPGQASTTIPAKKASTISISDSRHICWHPGDITNEDLLAMFKRDFAAAHNGTDYTTLADNNGELQAYMTSDTSPWKWLGDYLLKRGAQRKTMALPSDVDSNDNEELWVKFKAANSALSSLGTLASIKSTSQGRPHSDPNNPCGCRIICNDNDLSPSVTKSILTSSEWSWLKDYIKSVQTNLVDNIDDDTNNYWKYAVAAFFLQSQHSSWPTSADFSTAGKPANWGPHSPYWTETVRDLPDDEIDKNSEWRRLLEAFFDCTQITTEGGFITPDYSTDGQPSEWKDAWIASFPSNPSAVKEKGLPSGIIRNNDIFAGWYYGNKCTSSSRGYNITTPVTEDSIGYDCVYARWLEPTLHEGYVTDTLMIAEQRDTYNNFNLDLINIIATSGEPYDLQIDRKLQGGMYNTMCLPFDINGKNEFANIQYADGSVKPFASVNDFSLVRYTGSEALDEVLKLTFTELGNEETLEANTPFLLKPNKDITKLMQYGTATIKVVVHDQGQAVEDDGEGDDGEGDDGGGAIIPQTPAEYALTVPGEMISYTGVLAPTTIPEGSVLLVANNRLAISSSSGEMLGMRGFFSPLVLPIQQPMAIQITTKDGATTYLDAVNMTTETQAATKILYNGQIYILRGNEVYTITGNRVQ